MLYVNKNADRKILIKLCEKATYVDHIFQNLPKAISNNFDAKIIQLAYKVDYNSQVSNSHSCPIDGVQNFMRDSSKPLHYKGLKGYIEFSIINNEHLPSSSGMFGNRGTYSVAGVNLGSGGGSSIQYMKDGKLYIGMKYNYDVKVFVDDFEFLKSAVDAKFIEMEMEATREERIHKLKHPNRYYYRKPIKLSYEGFYRDDSYRELKE